MDKQNKQTVQAIILAAGGGTRFKSGISKLAYSLCGQEIILYPVKLMKSLHIPTTIIVGHQKNRIIEIVKKNEKTDITFVEQKVQQGTGHAVLCSQPVWNCRDILVLNGDGPMLTQEVITKLCEAHTSSDAAISLVVSHYVDEGAYGRLVNHNGLVKIVEAKHFNYTKEQFPYINAGIYIINRTFLETSLNKIKQNATTSEFYLTDLIEIASRNHLPVKTVVVPYDLIRGINTLKDLSEAQLIKKNELIERFMANGVQFENPLTVHIDLNVHIGAGTYIGSGVQLCGKTTIGKHCHIGAYSILKNATLKEGTTVVDFSKIAP